MAELYSVEGELAHVATLIDYELSADESALVAMAATALSGARWYAVSVCPRHEKAVAVHIASRELTCLLPVYRSVRRWKDRQKKLDMVLFPGYVFVNLDLRDRASVLRVPGVVRFVTFQGQPAAVPDSEILAFESTVTAGLHLQPHPYLREGRKVRVSSGPLAGAEGILVRRKEQFRLVLSIELIMRSVMLEIDESNVQPL